MITFGTNPGMGMAVDAAIPADTIPKRWNIWDSMPANGCSKTRRLRFRRQLHQRPHRRPAAFRPSGRGTAQSSGSDGMDRPRLEGRGGRREGRRTGSDSRRRRIRTAPAGLLGLSGDSRRFPPASTASRPPTAISKGVRGRERARCCRALPRRPLSAAGSQARGSCSDSRRTIENERCKRTFSISRRCRTKIRTMPRREKDC